MNGHETFFLNGNEYEVETSVLSALKYDRFQNSFALTELIARVSVGPLASCAACIKERSLLSCEHRTESSAPRAATIVPLLSLASLIPSRPPRTRSTGEQASETPPLRFLYGRGAIRFLGSVSYATARQSSSPTSSTSSSSTTSASPSSSS